MRTRLLISVLLITAVFASAQKSQSDRSASPAKKTAPRMPMQLLPNSSNTVSVLPFSYYGEPLCDSEGNLYFHRDTGISDIMDILRISPTGEEDGGARIDGDLATKYLFISFAVAPSGGIYVLVQGTNPALVSFGSDGKVRDKTELEVPPEVTVMTFAVFNDGSVIASGAYNGLAGAAQHGKRYMAIFESSGKLRAKIKSAGGSAKRSVYPIRFNEGGIAIGRDDNAYILDGSRILVISEYGEIVRRINYGSKLTGEIGARLNISGGLLVVALNSPGEAMIDRKYLVLDAETGEDLGLYSASVELQNQDVCFSERDGFTFLVVDKGGKLLRVIAPLR